MILPITVSVTRELGNAGDVVVTVRDSAGAERKLQCPGDCSPYHAIASIREGLQEILNEWNAKRPEDAEREPETIDTLVAGSKPSAGDA